MKFENKSSNRASLETKVHNSTKKVNLKTKVLISPCEMRMILICIPKARIVPGRCGARIVPCGKKTTGDVTVCNSA
jgi:hypothetical protein